MTTETPKPFKETLVSISFRVIAIEWEKATEKHNNQKDLLYCTYGDSAIYGLNKLLYIGLTTQEFRFRDVQHMQSDFNRIINPSYRIGTIKVSPISDMPQLLKITESLLITMLKPSYNSDNIKTVHEGMKTKDEHYLISNRGNRGALPLEISNIWW